MRKTSLIILMAVAFALAALVGTMAIAQDTKSGKVNDVLKIHDPLFGKHTKVAVTLSHKKHSVDYKIKCTECHHDYKNGKNMWKEGDKVAKCASCHKDPKKNNGKVLSLQNAFHKNCQPCHRQAKKGPTKCNECHPKK
ncbi:MAG: cytochrome c3 family protein [Thermodesulfobacteriota bacterium]